VRLTRVSLTVHAVLWITWTSWTGYRQSVDELVYRLQELIGGLSGRRASY
jgi:hypothetical protein